MDLIGVMDKYNSLNDVKWQEGRCSGTIYCAEKDKNELLSAVRVILASFTLFCFEIELDLLRVLGCQIYLTIEF